MRIEELGRDLIAARAAFKAMERKTYEAQRIYWEAEKSFCTAVPTSDAILVGKHALVVDEEWFELDPGRRVSVTRIHTPEEAERLIPREEVPDGRG